MRGNESVQNDSEGRDDWEIAESYSLITRRKEFVAIGRRDERNDTSKSDTDTTRSGTKRGGMRALQDNWSKNSVEDVGRSVDFAPGIILNREGKGKIILTLESETEERANILVGFDGCSDGGTAEYHAFPSHKEEKAGDSA